MKDIDEITSYNLPINYAGKMHKISKKFSLSIPKDSDKIVMHYVSVDYEPYCNISFRDKSDGIEFDSIDIKDENIGHLKKWLNDNCSKLEEMIE